MKLQQTITQISKFLFFLSFFWIFVTHSFAQSDPTQTKTAAEIKALQEINSEYVDGVTSATSKNEDGGQLPVVDGPTPEELVKKAWAANARGELDKLAEFVEQCRSLYGEAALIQSEQLTGLPERQEIDNYNEYNHLGLMYFIHGEALMNRGQKEKSIEIFQKAMEEFPYAQAWDPRGQYWSIEEKSRVSVNCMLGKCEDEDTAEIQDMIYPRIYKKGTEDFIDYTKYGQFLNVGTSKYHYSVKDREGLLKALGEGIYPDISSVYKSPYYKKIKKSDRMIGEYWNFVNTHDLEASYYKWFKAKESWGVRLFYMGMVFEKSKMYYQALKAYHALVVHFPKTIAWTYWQTPWYPSQAAVAKIKHIIRIHPELGLDVKWMSVKVENGFDNDINNDIFTTYPGKIFKKGMVDNLKDSFKINEQPPLGKIVNRRVDGEVSLVQYENSHWRLIVEGKPYPLRGITLDPTKIGESPDKGTLENWMDQDSNNNGKIDAPYDSWVDKNRNNEQDEDEPVVGDFQLLKEMGVNTIRFYHDPTHPNKELLRDAYASYGMRFIIGDFLGKYAIASGADWSEGTDYTNPEHRKNMFEAVKKVVLEHKDEPYVLLWLLGNENNYGLGCNADKEPEAYFKFANEVAQWIKSVDPNHPVALCNGDALYLDVFAKHSPDIDIFAANVYRGDYGFGSFWEQVFDATGRPAFITEFGSPAYAPHLTLEDAEQAQADYHKGNWLDIEDNMAGQGRGIGNALGGVVFQWMDEWWKNYEPFRHDKKSNTVGPFPGGYYFEEWFGLVGQGNGQHSPFMRQLRKSYFIYQELWNKKQLGF